MRLAVRHTFVPASVLFDGTNRLRLALPVVFSSAVRKKHVPLTNKRALVGGELGVSWFPHLKKSGMSCRFTCSHRSGTVDGCSFADAERTH